jgi:hypothetical protein
MHIETVTIRIMQRGMLGNEGKDTSCSSLPRARARTRTPTPTYTEHNHFELLTPDTHFLLQATGRIFN